MMQYYLKERSFKAYKAECQKDRRLAFLNVFASIALLLVIGFALFYHGAVGIASIPVIWLAIRIEARIKRIIKSQYMYL